ncbi:MAG: hypothetical protein RLZZ324_448 [Candidatus Parcubacteria bacterium]
MSEPTVGLPNAETPEVRPESAEQRPSPEQAQAESGVARERAAEDVSEERDESRDAAVEAGAAAERRAKRAEIVRPPDEVGVKIERALEDNLWDVYVGLPDPFRTTFKTMGEDTARLIRAQLVRAHVHASKIHALVHKWLKKIPGVNWAFLLQESKIKTDVFLRLAQWIASKSQ